MLSRIFLVDCTWQERFGAPWAMARFHEGIAENHVWKASQRGRRSGEIRYHLDQQTLHAATKGTQTSALTALPTGQHGSMPCCHQATVRAWWAGTQLTVAPSGHLRRGRTGVERSETVGFSSPPLRASAPAAQWAAAKPSGRLFIISPAGSPVRQSRLAVLTITTWG